MSKISQKILDSLIEDYSHNSYEVLVSKWILEKVPVVFNGNLEEYLRIKDLIAKGLQVDMCSVVFVGSSSTGFSLSPHKDFKEFDDASDIDIAIVSYHHFNVAWRWMRQVDLSTLNSEVKRHIQEHRKHFIFDGTIATDYILPHLPFGKLWGEVLSNISKESVFAGREVKFRLYQDHKSLVDYHINNMKNNIPNLLGVKSEDVILQ